MENRNDDELEIDLAKLFGALWQRAWVIVLAAVICAGVALAGTRLFTSLKYKAEAQIYVKYTSSSSFSWGDTEGNISEDEFESARSLIKTGIALMNTRSVLNEVIEQSGVNYSYGQLKSMIQSEASNGTEVLSIRVTCSAPEDAVLIANTAAKVLSERISSELEGASARILDSAVDAAAQKSSGKAKITVIGGLLGAVAACAVIAVMYLMDNKIHDTDYLTEAYDIPVLAVIPDLPTLENAGRSGKGNAARKAR